MRLNRYISAAGASSRRRGEDIIRAGRVSVNEEVVADPARDIDPGRDRVALDGRPLVLGGEKRYYVMNKPAGMVVSRGDTHGRPTVFDLLGPETRGVFPVGRLDKDTTGVLLFTDDGDLAHRLAHPSFGVEKVYRAEVEGSMDDADVREVESGVKLDDGPTAPARMRVLDAGPDVSIVDVVLREGRKREVRRMLAALGHPVRFLERLSFGGIAAEGLPAGDYRPLTGGEVCRLKRVTRDTPGEDVR